MTLVLAVASLKFSFIFFAHAHFIAMTCVSWHAQTYCLSHITFPSDHSYGALYFDGHIFVTPTQDRQVLDRSLVLVGGEVAYSSCKSVWRVRYGL